MTQHDFKKVAGLRLFPVLLFTIIMFNILSAQSLTSVTLFSGAIKNIPSPLKIKQNGQPDIEFNAAYHSRPFDDPFYYAIKLALEFYKMNWEIQLIHHKLFLANPPSQVQHFEVTHGFNILTINRVIAIRSLSLTFGSGIVLPHALSEIRNKKHTSTGGILNSGYRLSGPVFLAGLGRKFPVSKKIFVSLETQVIHGAAKVAVAGGEANVISLSIHGMFGLGYRL